LDPVLLSVSALTVYPDSVAVALTVPQQHLVRLSNGHELSVLHFQSPPSQLLVLQGVDEYQCTVSATYTVSIMGCSLAGVADMSHLHSARKKKYSSLKYQVGLTLGLDHSGCCQGRPCPPTAVTQPPSLLFPILLPTSAPPPF